jgi:hypothetical protein
MTEGVAVRSQIASAFLGRRWQRRQASGAKGVSRNTFECRERTSLSQASLEIPAREGSALSQRELKPAASAVGGAGLRPAGAGGGEGRG